MWENYDFVPGSKVLFFTDFSDDRVGNFARRLKYVKGPVEVVERDAASARAAARNGEADLFLTDWYGDYPDPENFTYPLLHSRNHGPGGNLAFLTDPALDSLIVRARSTPDTAHWPRHAWDCATARAMPTS